MLFQTVSEKKLRRQGGQVKTLIRMFLAAVVALGLVGATWAQTERGTIRGTIQDPSGAVMAGVKLSAVNVATGVAWATTSTSAGLYNIPNLPAGTYRVTAEMKGFKTLVQDNVAVAVAAVVGVDFKMEVGPVTEAVTVTAAAAPLQTENTERALTLPQRSYMDLPLTAGGQRSPEAFFLLSPGVTGDTFATRVNGSMALSREIQLEGMSINDSEIGSHSAIMLNQLSPDAIQEFSVATSTYSAEFGNTGGGIMRYTVRSGTNEFHGNVYEYFKNRVLDARGFFAKKRNPDYQNEFGGSIGGPIRKNRTFFFFNWNSYRLTSGANNLVASVPPAAFRQGDFSGLKDSKGNTVQIYDPTTTRSDGAGGFIRDPFQGNIIPPSQISALPKAILSYVPLPNVPGAGLVNNFVSSGSSTTSNNKYALKIYVGALTAGAKAFCFDEPEFWAQAGYSEAFKQEWKARYGTVWQPPHSSADARYKSEQLKAFLLRRWVETILEDVQQRKSSVTRMIAMHSPVNYYQIRMATPHHSLVSIPALQEVIAEVWNQPFEVGYLEYSSFYHLVRGTGKRLWFMMDPWGDSPALSLDFYRRSYGANLLAALMFPQIDAYQPLIWPNRVYGHVPKEYETLINTVVGALGEMWRYPHGRVEAGSRGIGTFIADSMGWQRAEPSPSDFDGFYGLSLPLVLEGVPVEVLSLDRVAEPGYLDAVRSLLVSYDFLKPADASVNRALADWTRRGGTLVFFGGADAYNAVSETWWRRAGYASPVEDLLAQMGLPIRSAIVLSDPGKEMVLEATTSTFDSSLARLRVPLGPPPGEEDYRRQVSLDHLAEISEETAHTCPITLYAPPSGASPLYRIEGEPVPAVWEAGVGKGRAIFVGVAPGYLKSSRQGPAWVRALAKYALENAGGTYREQPYFLVRRGPYTAIRTLDKPYTAQGRYVDLLSPVLAVLENPAIPAHECAFLADAGQARGTPRVLAVSGRLRAYYEGARKTSFLTQAPAQTEGVARVWAGQRRLKAVRAFTVLGAALPLISHREGNTVLLRYANDADGVVVRVEWEPGNT